MSAGGCGCGAVRYEMAGAPIFVNCCHCGDCQRITGSAFAINAMIETDRLAVTAGTLDERRTGGARAWHCPDCAGLLWAEHPALGDGIRFLRAGTLDEAGSIEPDAHYFTIRKRAWVTIPEGVPRFDRLPEGDPSEGMPADKRARMLAAAGWRDAGELAAALAERGEVG